MAKQLKHELGRDAVRRITTALQQVNPLIDSEGFENDAIARLDALELKERVHQIIRVLHQHLPDNYLETITILKNIKEVWNYGDPDDPYSGFAAWPVIDYIGCYGLDEPELSLDALKELTEMFTAEFAIRPFLEHHYNLTFCHLHAWCDSERWHLRRLVSEGTRSRLPWATKVASLIRDPEAVINLLDRLVDDPNPTVRRSVANNINDISKDHPELAIATCLRWQKKLSDDRDWIIRHGMRTLVKQGHSDVFPLLGFTPNPVVTIEAFRVSEQEVVIGDDLEFELELLSHQEDQHFVLDYAIDYQKANGSVSKKVFKLRVCQMYMGERLVIRKSHSFNFISTRKHYPGEHKMRILVNGEEVYSHTIFLK
ncbi:3-methyladenine DNA glycosylase AlkC [Mariprofundus aestuarium]|uniref:3-methyladenine DNA glycosylase AlkC n=1 Tax=Mariprofundus aestuarium TaxID=1921086 RepID=A0A2K8L0W3_MARES|nr:DNA alkylation repair protein [Mariprofundus aestuarium]ATX80712.1 3-methyladenine DNA glycosylase AlkC [Mariprofundus aestuarium]